MRRRRFLLAVLGPAGSLLRGLAALRWFFRVAVPVLPIIITSGLLDNVLPAVVACRFAPTSLETTWLLVKTATSGVIAVHRFRSLISGGFCRRRSFSRLLGTAVVIPVVTFDLSSAVSIVVPSVVLSPVPVVVPVPLLPVPLLPPVAVVTARVLSVFPVLNLLAFPINDVFLRLGVGLFPLLFESVPLALV